MFDKALHYIILLIFADHESEHQLQMCACVYRISSLVALAHARAFLIKHYRLRDTI
jgi:hypothetical protein